MANTSIATKKQLVMEVIRRNDQYKASFKTTAGFAEYGKRYIKKYEFLTKERPEDPDLIGNYPV